MSDEIVKSLIKENASFGVNKIKKYGNMLKTSFWAVLAWVDSSFKEKRASLSYYDLSPVHLAPLSERNSNIRTWI